MSVTRCSLVLVAWLLAVSTHAQEQPQPVATLSESAQREMTQVQDLLARAVAEFDGAQQSRSIVLFDEIVARLDALRHQGALSPRGREILAQSLELRARAYYNIGLQEKASDSFRSLIQLQPSYAVSKEKVSPKIVDFFNSVKKALVGYLAVSSTPAGARVTLNGEFLSLTNFFPLEVLAGEYVVEISREGYRTETRNVSVAPRATETLPIELVRTAASAFFVTDPPGVEVWMDGTLAATTAGSLSPDRFEAVRAKGIDPSRASERTEIANLSLGSHVVELKRKCYETVRLTLDVPEPRDYDLEPVRLEESLASLSLTSEPPGAKIFLDGEALGVTPREIEGVCSGRHRLEVKHTAGKFLKDIVLARDENLSLDCPIRPSLALLGVVAESAAGERNVPVVEEGLERNLSKVASLNVFPAPRETVDRILESERLTRKALVSATRAEADVVRRVTEKLAAALDVQGFLVAVLPDERLQRTAMLHLLAAGNSTPDPWEVTWAEAASYLRFISAVDQRATLYRPWTGLITVDTLIHDGVPVLRMVPLGPAEKAGIRVGDVIYAVEGKAVKRTADLLAALEGRKSGDRMSLHLRGAAGTRSVDLELAETPQEIPLNDPTLLYNKIMMDLRQQAEGYPGTEASAFAQLNLALCAMHFGDYAAAHDYLMKAKSILPQRPGLSQGTALYYLGLSLENLGTEYRREAAEAYRAAAAFKDATLFNNDGPAVAPLAARRGGN
ncbi:MAG TPA: PEGA domain-containing protein [Vicinamibacteria bacterium]|nr:PEGA domain-containing protein [Vicinamibacteria bacterium]